MADLLGWKKKEVRNVLKPDLKESREGFIGRGRGRSLLVKGEETGKACRPTQPAATRQKLPREFSDKHKLSGEKQ